jgi:hypothetical protein
MQTAYQVEKMLQSVFALLHFIDLQREAKIQIQNL